jgi:single-stranded-DNA-specific exonuclease
MDVSERFARLLALRGVSDPEQARMYLRPTVQDIPNPLQFKDIEKAAHRLAEAIEQTQPITLYGDYDVDGVTSTTLLAAFLREHGIVCRTYIPKRLREGYGLNHEAVDQIAADGTRLMVTLDCGITAADELMRAKELGVDCIVVDHHRCPPKLPTTIATLNHQQEDCSYPEKTLAAVGIAFNLVLVLRKVLRERGFYRAHGKAEPNMLRYLDLVALGTIADMVPLTGINRTLVWLGMVELRKASRPGIRALIEVSERLPGQLTSGDVAFRLGPRINAAGRLDDASVGIRLLLADDLSTAKRLAEALDAANRDRRRIEGVVFKEAEAQVDGMARLPEIIVLGNPDWHPGVVGIVASKLVEKYGRPAVLVGEGGRGSARAAQGLHIYHALRDVSSFLLKFGGHHAAAGFRLSFKDFEAFREALEARVRDEGTIREQGPPVEYDDELAAEHADDACLAELAQFEPFGNGNPEPVFRLRGIEVESTRVVGQGHLKVQFRKGPLGGLRGIAFKKGELQADLPPGQAADVVAHLVRNDFGGFSRPELMVREIVPWNSDRD